MGLKQGSITTHSFESGVSEAGKQTQTRRTGLKTAASAGEMVRCSFKGSYLGLSQWRREEDTPPPQVRLHSSQGDQSPQPPSTPSGRVP